MARASIQLMESPAVFAVSIQLMVHRSVCIVSIHLMEHLAVTIVSTCIQFMGSPAVGYSKHVSTQLVDLAVYVIRMQLMESSAAAVL